MSVMSGAERGILIFLRNGALDEELAAERRGCEDFHDFFGGGAVAVRIGHTFERLAERVATRLGSGIEDTFGVCRCVEDIACAFAALLANANVDCGQCEGRGFHDAAAGIAEEKSSLAEKAPVSDSIEIDEDAAVAANVKNRFGAFDQCAASRVGIGITEEKLFGKLFERGEKRIRLFERVVCKRDGVIGDDGAGNVEIE